MGYMVAFYVVFEATGNGCGRGEGRQGGGVGEKKSWYREMALGYHNHIEIMVQYILLESYLHSKMFILL